MTQQVRRRQHTSVGRPVVKITRPGIEPGPTVSKTVMLSSTPTSHDGWLHSHKSRRLGSHQHDLLYKSSAFLCRATSAGFVRISSPTRNRTRNFWLEARDDVRFTIEPFQTSGRRGSRTLITRRWHALAVRPGKPYPAAFRKQIESGPEGNRTLLTDLARISRPLGTCQPICFKRHSEVRPGIEPGLRPYHRRVLPQHLQTLSFQ